MPRGVSFHASPTMSGVIVSATLVGVVIPLRGTRGPCRTHHLECLADIGHCAMPHVDGAVQPIAGYVDEGMQPLRTIWSTPAGS
jgi:hypothetical protein